MQLYLARLGRRDSGHLLKNGQPKLIDDVKLVDGSREHSVPMVYFTRAKLQKGRYLLFYRVAHKSLDEVVSDAGSALGSSEPATKLVVGMNVPKNAAVTMTRVNTTWYGKSTFLELKAHYKAKFEK